MFEHDVIVPRSEIAIGSLAINFKPESNLAGRRGGKSDLTPSDLVNSERNLFTETDFQKRGFRVLSMIVSC